jgi:hypothetical protein
MNDHMAADLANLADIKIETEDGEFDVIAGGVPTLRRTGPMVLFEMGDNSLLHYDATSADMYDLLSSLDYRVYDILGRALDRTQFVESSVVDGVRRRHRGDHKVSTPEIEPGELLNQLHATDEFDRMFGELSNKSAVGPVAEMLNLRLDPPHAVTVGLESPRQLLRHQLEVTGDPPVGLGDEIPETHFLSLSSGPGLTPRTA